MADFMKTNAEAKQLICPQMSRAGMAAVSCLGSECALWCRERRINVNPDIKQQTHANDVSFYRWLDAKESPPSVKLMSDEDQMAEYAALHTAEPERPANVPSDWTWIYYFDPEFPWDFWCGWEETEEGARQRELDTVKGWCGLIRVVEGARR